MSAHQEQEKPSPVEVWLTQRNLVITCREVHEDETVTERPQEWVESLSLRGAQREVTGWYLEQGYVPVGRWEYATAAAADWAECFRRFRLASAVGQ